jgi:hypothetical protein
LKITSGSNGSSSITVQGTLANLNAALSGLKFTPTTGFAGAASVRATYKNLGIEQTTVATTAVSVVVPASKPTIKIEAPSQGAAGKAVTFELVATDTNATARAADYQFSIDFGDGTAIKTVTSKSPLVLTHVFAHAGSYTVKAAAKDEYGHLSAVVSVTIRIVALPTLGNAVAGSTTASAGPSTDDSSATPSDFEIPDTAETDRDTPFIQWPALSAAIDLIDV